MALNINVSDILAKADADLQGEPARAIGYGAALVIVGVVAVSNALGYSRFGADLSVVEAVGLAGTAIATLTGIVESIRRFVFSPATVANLVADHAIEAPVDPNTEITPDPPIVIGDDPAVGQ